MTTKIHPMELLMCVIAGDSQYRTHLPGGVTLKTGFGVTTEPDKFGDFGILKRTARIRQAGMESAGPNGLYYVMLDVGIAQSRLEARDTKPSHLSVIQCAEWLRDIVSRTNERLCISGL